MQWRSQILYDGKSADTPPGLANSAAALRTYVAHGTIVKIAIYWIDTSKQFRKMINNLLNVKAAKAYVPYQMLENKQMLYEMLKEPAEFLYHLRMCSVTLVPNERSPAVQGRYSNAITTTITFGWRTPTYDDPKMKQFYKSVTNLSMIVQLGTAALIDFFPVLRQLPDWMMPLKAKAKRHFEYERKLYVEHWLNAKESIQRGTSKPCFCVGMAEVQETEGFSDDQAAYVSGTLLEGGSEPTANTLYGFMQAMLLFPEVQETAQAEIDQVIGTGRLPTMKDEMDLPYVRACVKETLRWGPTTILGGIPHAVTKDDHYMGYLIPKGAAVMNNVWTVNMDPGKHSGPRTFDPTRYVDVEPSVLGEYAASPKRDLSTFGAGGRLCPGVHVASRSLFLAMSRLLAAFNIEPVLDMDGKPVFPDPNRVTQGITCMPEPFQARIVPRSEEMAKLVEKEWKDAERQSLDPVTKQWLKVPEEVIAAVKM